MDVYEFWNQSDFELLNFFGDIWFLNEDIFTVGVMSKWAISVHFLVKIGQNWSKLVGKIGIFMMGEIFESQEEELIEANAKMSHFPTYLVDFLWNKSKLNLKNDFFSRWLKLTNFKKTHRLNLMRKWAISRNVGSIIWRRGWQEVTSLSVRYHD